MTTVWANTIVKNEEKYLWFAIKSVIDFVNKIIIWDTGSTDETVEIIKKLQTEYPSKIEFKETGAANRNELSVLRQQMLEGSDCDWILILDGDEVWWQDSIKKVVATILYKGEKLDSIVSPYINLVGDIYHRQDEEAGRYRIDGRTGFLTIRAINRKTPGIHVDRPYGQEGYFDASNVAIQERPPARRELIQAPYLHLSHLPRSSKAVGVIDRRRKLKYEVGETLPLDFIYPEVFFVKRPEEVVSPWQPASFSYWVKAYLLEPARLLKRKLLHG